MVKNGGLDFNFDLEFAAPVKLGVKRIVVKEAVSKRTKEK